MASILYSAFDIFPSPKGAGTHISYFVRGLLEQQHRVHLFTPGDGVLPAEDSYEGAPVTRVPPVNEASWLERALSFGEAVLKHASGGAYDAMHYRSIWSGLPLSQNKKRFGYKTLFEVNGLPSIELKYHYPAFRDLPTPESVALMAKIREQEMATLQLSDAIVCPSEVTRSFLISLGARADRITVIPNGVAHEFAATPLLPLEGRPAVILYLGTFADWQGLQLLLEAMPGIISSVPVVLKITGRGRGRQRKALQKKVQKLGLSSHVILQSAVPHHEAPGLIAGADVCVAPLSPNDRNVTQGCCPIKILEYMACGRPLVASNLPVVRELVRENREALLFSPDDPSDLARQIVRVVSDRKLAESIAGSASERAHSEFSWRKAQKSLARVYRRLL